MLDTQSPPDNLNIPTPKPSVKKRPPLSTRPNPQYIPFAFNIIGAAHYCSVGSTVIYEAVNDGKLRMRKLGGKTVFLREDLEDWLRNEAVESMPVPKRPRSPAPAGSEAA